MKEHFENELIYMFILEFRGAKTLGLIPATCGLIWKNRTKLVQMFWKQGMSNPGPAFMNTWWFPFFSQRKLYIKLAFVSSCPLKTSKRKLSLAQGKKQSWSCSTAKPGCCTQAALKSLWFSPHSPNTPCQLRCCPHSWGSIQQTLWGLGGILATRSKHPILFVIAYFIFT